MGDALHALNCSAGYNILWLLRAIARLCLRGPFCALSTVVLYIPNLRAAVLAATKTVGDVAGRVRQSSMAFKALRLGAGG